MARLLEMVPLPSALLDWAGLEQLLGLFDVAGCYVSFGQGDVAEVKITFRQPRLGCFGLAGAVCLFPCQSRFIQRMTQADAVGEGDGNSDKQEEGDDSECGQCGNSGATAGPFGGTLQQCGGACLD